MDIQVAYYPQAFILVLARVAAIICGTALFGKAMVMPRVRVAVSFVVALVFTPLAPESWTVYCSTLHTVPQLLFAVLSEALLGAVIGLICDLFIGVFAIAGQLAGLSSSLAMSTAIDPVNGVSSNILGQIFNLVFYMVVLISNGHLLLLKLLFNSFASLPPQFDWMTGGLLNMVFRLGSTMFELGIKLAAPVVTAVLIIDTGLGLISRMAPEFNILFLSLPIRLFVGIAMLGFTLRFGGSFLNRMVEQLLAHCARILTG